MLRNVLGSLLKGRVSIKHKYAYSSKKLDVNIEEEDGPIKYTASPASKLRAALTTKNVSKPRLWYEPYVVIVSTTIFMVYFCYLREENDIDQEFTRTLYSRIGGLEESQLIQVLEYNKRHGLDTTAIVQRLKELQRSD